MILISMKSFYYLLLILGTCIGAAILFSCHPYLGTHYCLSLMVCSEQVDKRFHRNQNHVGMVVVNKVRKHSLSTLHCLHNHPYISSCSIYLRLAALYVGMVMWDGVEYQGCDNILTCLHTLFTTTFPT